MEKRKVIEDIVVLLLLIALCVYVVVASFGFKSTAGIMPRLIACVTGALCCIQLGSSLIRYTRAKSDEMNSDGARKKAIRENRLLLASLTLILYFASIMIVGFYAGTLVYLIGTMVAFGFRKKLGIAFICIGMIVFMYALFERLLYVKLPTGMFF